MSERGLGDGAITEVAALGGGTQNVMVTFNRAGRTYVLRRGPRHLRPFSNSAILRETRILKALADTDVPHPRLIDVCADTDTLSGAVFYLMEPVDGFNASVELPALHANDPEIRRKMAFNIVDVLAELGEIDYRAVGLEDYGKPDGFLERQVPRWIAELDSYNKFEGYRGAGIPNVVQVADWLECHRPERWSAGILHGDFHSANVMFDRCSADIVAVVDWEMCTIGDPLLDLGWLLATWQLPQATSVFGGAFMASSLPSADELVAQYARRSSRDVTTVTWYTVLACFKLGIVLEGTYARAQAGLAPRRTGDELHSTTLQLFERADALMNGEQ
ncbi:phosphotransferase family protein [Mycobacterium sp. SMC-19]|uniref:phosphotransferase family protein n=1 Tax=Mycobacterium sp. SMC-19 TaxID=3381630 RepID=UPI00387683E5